MLTALILQILGAYSNDVLVAVTSVLVVLTGFYAFQTKKTVDVLKKTAEMEFLPKIKGHVHMVGPVHLHIRVSNVGKGSAIGLQVTFVVVGTNTVKRNWTQPLFVPGDFQDFPIPKSESEEESSVPYFQENETKIEITSTFSDILGKRHSNSESINISEFVRQFKTTISIYHEEYMNKISRNVDSISDELKNITRNLSSVGNAISNRTYQDLIKFKFTNLYHRLNEMNSNLHSDVWLFLYSLENELLTSKRDDILKAILTKLKEKNIKVFEQVADLEEFKHLGNL